MLGVRERQREALAWDWVIIRTPLISSPNRNWEKLFLCMNIITLLPLIIPGTYCASITL